MKRLIIIAAVLVLFAAGCGNKSQEQPANGPSAAANGQTNQAGNPATQTPPAPSRISRVAYSAREYTTDGSTSKYAIYMIDGATGSAQRMTAAATSDRHPVWSPDGTRIAYLAFAGTKADIYVMDVRSRTTTKMTKAPLANVTPGTLFWPAGDKIYYTATGDPWWALDLTSGNTGTVNSFVFGNTTVPATEVMSGAVSFSGDTTCLARLSADRKKIACTGGNGATLGEIPLNDANIGNHQVAIGPWSPDKNSLIVYDTTSHVIYVADIKTGLLRSLAAGTTAVWSGDGANIIYITPEAQADLVDNGLHKMVRSSGICIIPAAGGQERQVPMKTSLVDAVAQSATDGAAGQIDFATLSQPATQPVAAAAGATGTPGATGTQQLFAADPAGGVALVGDFAAKNGFILLKSNGSGESVVAASRQGTSGRACEVTTYNVQNGKYAEAGKAAGSADDESKYELKFKSETFKALDAAEKTATIGHEPSADKKVLFAGEAKIGNATKRLIVHAAIQGNKWTTYANLYRYDGHAWKKEWTGTLESGTGGVPAVNAGLRDMDGDGHPELLIAHTMQNDDGLYETLKVYKISGN